jgi:hypothetical protein
VLVVFAVHGADPLIVEMDNLDYHPFGQHGGLYQIGRREAWKGSRTGC